MTESVGELGGVSYLTSILGAELQSRFTALLAPLRLRPQQYGALRRIASHDGCTQQDVADLMHIRRNVVVGLLDTLEQDGLVTRGRHPSDRRAHALHLTAEGSRRLGKAHEAARALDEALLDAVVPQHRGAFVSALRAVGVAFDASAGSFPENTDVAAGHTADPAAHSTAGRTADPAASAQALGHHSAELSEVG